MKKKNIDILEHIKLYCNDIESTMNRFGREKNIFEIDRDFRNSICMSLLQIGELTGHLSEAFREGTRQTIYWPAIKGMRNLFAHNYGALDVDRVWETVKTDIPALSTFCDSSIEMYHFMEQEEVAEKED